MNEAGPYGITQVSVPAAISAYRQGKADRMEELDAECRRRHEDKVWAREDAERAAWAKVFTPRQRIAAGVIGKYDPNTGASVAPAPAGAATAPATAPIATPVPVTPQPQVSPPVEQPGSDTEDYGLSINTDGLRALAAVNPKAAMELSKMSDEQRLAAYKRIGEGFALNGRIINAIRQHPVADRQGAYQVIRKELMDQGMDGLPEQWDEKRADELLQLGQTVMQAMTNDRLDRRLDADIADDEADNARADRNVNSVIAKRARLTVPKPEKVTASGVIGGILQKRASGQQLTAGEQEIYTNYMSRGKRGGKSRGSSTPAPQNAPGQTATDPKTGKKVQWNGSAWVPVG